MASGISLHIGLNQIDSAHYGTDGALSGCESDARAMERIAASLGYQTRLLLTRAALADEILAGIRAAAATLKAGDAFLFSYAGHGAQIPDSDGDEADALDETWCAFDRMIIDDELSRLWSVFAAGVRIVVVSDSCHSGTVIRDAMHSYRRLPPEIVRRAYDNHRARYRQLKVAAAAQDSALAAGVILLAGCQDNQLSADGNGNGLFTEKLLQVWDQGRYAGDYPGFLSAIRRLMPPTQTPGYQVLGEADGYQSQRPFALDVSEASPEPVEAPPAGPICRCKHKHKPQQRKETNMQTIVENGNWDEVAAALVLKENGSRGIGGDFLSRVIAANARAAETTFFGAVNDGAPAAAMRGGGVVRSYWWGFSIEVPHGDLVSLLNATDPKGEVVRFLRTILPSDYARWIDVIAPFVAAGASMLRGLDRGRGIYISMSWFAPGIFVPTTV